MKWGINFWLCGGALVSLHLHWASSEAGPALVPPLLFLLHKCWLAWVMHPIWDWSWKWRGTALALEQYSQRDRFCTQGTFGDAWSQLGIQADLWVKAEDAVKSLRMHRTAPLWLLGWRILQMESTPLWVYWSGVGRRLSLFCRVPAVWPELEEVGEA